MAAFLKTMKDIFEDKAFSADRDFILIRSKKEGREQYSTPYTLVDLDYDVDDVIKNLKELRIEDYSETLYDMDDANPPLLFVFGKDIRGRQIYIKVKIKNGRSRRVLCVSFHYAEYKMKFPYLQAGN